MTFKPLLFSQSLLQVHKYYNYAKLLFIIYVKVPGAGAGASSCLIRHSSDAHLDCLFCGMLNGKAFHISCRCFRTNELV